MKVYALEVNGSLHGVYTTEFPGETSNSNVVGIDLKICWENTMLQMARLITEAEAVGAFSDKVMQDLQVSMDLGESDINQLIDEAQRIFDTAKGEV